jgi:ribosomal protein S18 acetylase RimI-like enzyme
MFCLAPVRHHACVRLQRRLASPADAEFGRNVHHQAYRDVVERQFGAWNVAAQDAYFRDSWGAAPHEIVECDGVPVGYVCVEDRSDLVHVRELVLLPEFQNRGIGTAVLRELLAHAEGRGVPVQLGTLHANRAAALYRRLGFREIGRTQTHILFEWLPPVDR